MKLIRNLVTLKYLLFIYWSRIPSYTLPKMKISSLGSECLFKNSKQDKFQPLIAYVSCGVQDNHINFLVFFLEVR